MASSSYTLPLLPGASVNTTIGKERFHKSQGLVFENSQAVVKKEKPGIGGLTDVEAGIERLPSISGDRSTHSGPAWLTYDRQCLRFDAYVQEAVHERPGEQYRVRYCQLFFYPQDGTLQVTEKHQPNSGMLHGVLLKRHRVPRPAPEDDKFIELSDLNVGEDVTFYGRTYRITNCDGFTRQFLTQLGREVAPEQAAPLDPFTVTMKSKADAVQARRPFERIDKLKQFLTQDRRVLRFYCLWDDSRSEGGMKRYYVLHYFLADDTMELREIPQTNSGRSGPPLFLRRQRLPKSEVGLVKLPGQSGARTVLKTLGDVNHNLHILDRLRTGALAESFYSDVDLAIGNEINILGRTMLLCDCDDFTRRHYKERYGVASMDPLQLAEDPVEKFVREIPEHNGIGSEEDSLQSVRSLISKPPMKKAGKYSRPQTHVVDSMTMRFAAQFLTKNKDDAKRRFLISYYIDDDTVSVFEKNQRNSGIRGGKFLSRTKPRLPDGSGCYDAEHFYVGGVVTLDKHTFILTAADDYALKFLESAGFPRSNWRAVLQKIQTMHARKEELMTALTTTSTCPTAFFESTLLKWAQGELVEHEAITLARHYSTKRDVELSLRSQVDALQVALARQCYDRFRDMRHAFFHFDKSRTQSISKEELRRVCAEFQIPVQEEVLDAAVAKIGVRSLIDFSQFCRYFDYRADNVQSMAQESDLLKTPEHSTEMEPERVRVAQFLEDCFGAGAATASA